MPAFPSRVVLGRTGLSVCPLAVSGGYGVDDKSLLRAFDRGVNYWYHENRPGTVAYTATRWGSLLKAGNAPPGEAPMRGRDAYRFVLSNPDFNLCMTGPKDGEQMDEALAALDEGPLSSAENERVRRLGNYLYAKALRKG